MTEKTAIDVYEIRKTMNAVLNTLRAAQERESALYHNRSGFYLECALKGVQEAERTLCMIDERGAT